MSEPTKAKRFFEINGLKAEILSPEEIAKQGATMCCLPTRMVNEPGVPGSKKIMADCGHEVWIAPSGSLQLELANGSMPVICIDCLPKVAEQQ